METTQHTPANVRERVKEPTQAQIDDACMWYRHDFGLLSEKERDSVRFEARQWFRAWGKALSNGDDYAALLRTPHGEGEAEPVAWRVEYRLRGVGDARWYHLSTYTNEMDARERAKNAEVAMRVLECRIIPLYASPAAALRSEADALDLIRWAESQGAALEPVAGNIMPPGTYACYAGDADDPYMGPGILGAIRAARRGEGGGE